MADAIRVSGSVNGTDKTLSFETGKFALQSQGAVVATIGRTIVLSTANAAIALSRSSMGAEAPGATGGTTAPGVTWVCCGT